MSLPSSKQNASGHSSRETSEQRRERLPGRFTPESVLAPVRTVSFWVAVAMPFLSFPLLLTGLDTTFEIVAFLSLVAVNVAALVVGHGHNT